MRKDQLDSAEVWECSFPKGMAPIPTTMVINLTLLAFSVTEREQSQLHIGSIPLALTFVPMVILALYFS